MRKFFWALLSMLIFVHPAVAQKKPSYKPIAAITFQTLYNFTDHEDGCCIFSGIARDSVGNLYGVAYANLAGTHYGDLFKLTPAATGYTFKVLRSFSSADGGNCFGTPTFDNAGNMFGLCSGELVDGTLWEYSNQGKFSVLHTFYRTTEGMDPRGSVVIDNAGNIFGTTPAYGPNGGGTLWEYSSTGVFSMLHPFTFYGNDGSEPVGPTIDSTGKLWGVTSLGPNCYACGNGTIWNYDPSTGTFTILLNLDNTDIQKPPTRLALDSAGNFYGTAYGLGYGCGVVYELSPGNNYQPVILYHFTQVLGCGVDGSVVLDAQGNFFGTTYMGGTSNAGVAYELTLVNGVWKETVLHSFSGSDGNFPLSELATDGAGNWFGTTQYGGLIGAGTVFEISGVQGVDQLHH
jgi:hypothetical protein